MMIISILEPFPIHIITSPSTSLCLFCNSCFKLLIFSNRTSIKYPGATINTSKVHINNLYIKYTLVSLCHPSYPPNTWGSSASSDQSLCSGNFLQLLCPLGHGIFSIAFTAVMLSESSQVSKQSDAFEILSFRSRCPFWSE